MGLADSMKRLIGIEDLEEEEVFTDDEIKEAKEKVSKESAPRRSFGETTSIDRKSPSRAPEKRFSVANTSAFKLVLIEPSSFEECPKLVDSLKGRRPVIINLEKLETEVARKIFDFLSGATYALNGNVQKVANNIFIFAPDNVAIAGGQPEERPGFEFKADDSNPWR